MPGQIPGALGVLSDFLSQENARLDTEIKERDVRQTIDFASKEFSKIGPDATPQDVRQIYYDALSFASENKSEEAIPMLSNLFSESAQFIRQSRIEREDEALVKAIGQFTDLDLGGLSGTGATSVTGFDLQSQQFIKTRSKKGSSTAQIFKQREGKLIPKGEPIDIDLSTFEDQARAQRQGRIGSDRGLQKTTSTTPDGRLLYVYPEFGDAGGHYTVNVQTGKFERYAGKTIIREESLGKQRARSFREAEQNFDLAKGEVKSAGKSFATLLLKYGDKDKLLKSSVFKNINSDEYRAETYQTLLSYQEAGKLDELIEQAPEENKTVLYAGYRSFLEQLGNYRERRNDMNFFKGNLPGKTEGLPSTPGIYTKDLSEELNIPIGASDMHKRAKVLQVLEEYAGGVFNNNTAQDQKARERWQLWIKNNLRVTDVTSLDQLTADQREKFLIWLARVTNIQGIATE